MKRKQQWTEGGGNEGLRERGLTEERIALNLFPFVERQ